MWKPLLLLSEGARVLDESGRERPSCPVSRDELASVLGGDVWEAGFVRQLRSDKPSEEKLQLQLRSEKRGVNGYDLLQLARQATRRPNAIRHLERLYVAFPSVTPRIPAVHDFLDARRKYDGDDKQLAFFLNRVVPRRGRRLSWCDELQLVCWMNQLMHEGMSATEAAALLKAERSEAKHLAVDTLRNKSAMYGQIARIFAEGYFVPAHSLRPVPWGGVRSMWRMFVTD